MQFYCYSVVVLAPRAFLEQVGLCMNMTVVHFLLADVQTQKGVYFFFFFFYMLLLSLLSHVGAVPSHLKGGDCAFIGMEAEMARKRGGGGVIECAACKETKKRKGNGGEGAG